MTVRAKFRLAEDAALFGTNPPARKLTFYAMYDPSIPEDMRYEKYTPSGQFTMTCNNPAALEQFVLGKQYYFDITEVPEEANRPPTGAEPQPSV